MPDLIIAETPEGLAESAASKWVELANQAIQRRGRFCAALSGGSTPKALYELLTKPPFSSQVDWNRVHLFWGDERCVPPEDSLSNYRMVRTALLDALTIPPENIHRIQGELEPHLAAALYESELERNFPGQAIPHFDMVLLGLGEDGHTASLFPGTASLEEQERWVLAVEHMVPPLPLVPRITLTLPVINAAETILFLVSGAAKAERLAQVLQDTEGRVRLPARMVQPVNGKVIWMVDQAAASSVKKP